MTMNTLFFALFLCILSVQALQIPFNANKNSAHADDSTHMMLIKDNVQAHYETIVDEVLSQHNEHLLSELSTMIKDSHQLVFHLRQEANLLLDNLDPIQDICVAQIPGMIANHVHELSTEIYSSIYPIVGNIWQFNDNDFRKYLSEAIYVDSMYDVSVLEELTATLEFINMDISDAITETINDYDLISVITQSLLECQNEFMFEDSDSPEDSLSDKLWLILLSSLKQPVLKTTSSMRASRGFMGHYVAQLTHDLESEMSNGVELLASNIHRDLGFS